MKDFNKNYGRPFTTVLINRDFKLSWILQPVIIWDNQELNVVTYNNVLREQYEIHSYITVRSDCMV